MTTEWITLVWMVAVTICVLGWLFREDDHAFQHSMIAAAAGVLMGLILVGTFLP
jgi:hypothetical protein